MSMSAKKICVNETFINLPENCSVQFDLDKQPSGILVLPLCY